MATPAAPATFAVMHRRVTEAGVMAAIHEFQRRKADGDDNDLLIAEDVLLRRWLDGRLSGLAVFRATYEGDVMTVTTRGDIFITEVPGQVHQQAIFRVDYYHAGTVRRPDLAIEPRRAIRGDPRSHLPRCMIEVAVTRHTSFNKYDLHTRALFAEFPVLRTVLVLVVYPLRNAATLDPNMNPILAQMPALAVLYRRLGSNIAITDAMSCGNYALHGNVRLPGGVVVRNEVAAMAAELPLFNLGQPWNHGPFITLLGDDLYRASDGRGHIMQGLLPDYPVHLATTIAAAIRTGYEEATPANGLAAQATAVQAAAQAAVQAAAAPNVRRRNHRYNLRP
ncbi:hypothetical protein SDRG_03805 [Saprolegnia diclina VS20]|uniref:Uncharacterized protein n=1 Tax=Saprolegnia diclina (strain VS20) TaxID=1156394 RepID=T0S7U6_SAPDV|nr:hypothetical protein SDRG_03805 [Saprolegnia diclina VS20]EQC38847.1 hypothetical protein SDRG_03805 [Saprolegnia diclina VS20]|eukprot:XP_008607671.1 hypothetical protein SDRG_03805 [Saprolegnia diclina VS20]